MKSEHVEREPSPVLGAADGCPRILIVDDDPAVRALFARFLAEDGYHVTALGNYREAWAAVRETTYEVIVMDLSLQDIDGIEAIRNFHSCFPWMKILSVSGYMAGCVPSLVLSAGATATLGKPATSWQLRAAVYHLLDPAGTCRASRSAEPQRGRAKLSTLTTSGWS